MIDWTSESAQVTEHFTVRDCLYLHSFHRLASPDDGVDFDKLISLCSALEKIRAILGCPMNIHCMFRSIQYNAIQNIQPTKDVHSMSIAADFDCGSAMSIEDVKTALEPRLAELGVRMERGTTTWVHIDLREPGPSGRYFVA